MSKTRNYILRAKCRRIGIKNKHKKELRKYNIPLEEFYCAVITEHFKRICEKLIYGTSENKETPKGILRAFDK